MHCCSKPKYRSSYIYIYIYTDTPIIQTKTKKKETTAAIMKYF
jgi:hypothetical protein